MAFMLRFNQVLPGEVVRNEEGHVFAVVRVKKAADDAIWLGGADQLKDVAAGAPDQMIEAVGRCQWCAFPLPHTGDCLNAYCTRSSAEECYYEQPPWMTDKEWGRLLYLHVLEQTRDVDKTGRSALTALRLKAHPGRMEGHQLRHDERIEHKGPDNCCCYVGHPEGALALCCPICHGTPVCGLCNTTMTPIQCGREEHWFCELVICPASEPCTECTCDGAETGKHDTLNCVCSFELGGHGGPCKVQKEGGQS